MGVIFYRNMINRQIKDDRKLICSVKHYPVIYDTHHSSYNNVPERTRVWKLIAQNLGRCAIACEERWHRLLEMYNMTTSETLHIDLYEIMDQFLNMHCECDLSADDFEKQIDIEQILTPGLIDDTSPPADVQPFANDKPESWSEYSDGFCNTEEVELYPV